MQDTIASRISRVAAPAKSASPRDGGAARLGSVVTASLAGALIALAFGWAAPMQPPSAHADTLAAAPATLESAFAPLPLGAAASLAASPADIAALRSTLAANDARLDAARADGRAQLARLAALSRAMSAPPPPMAPPPQL